MNQDRTILIVDDEAELREMVRGIFARAGYGRVVTAGSGPEALSLCASARPDLVILDLNLPDGNGLDLLRRLRAAPSLPVLILTANDLEVDQVLGLELGADDFLVKSQVVIGDVVARIKHQLNML